MRKIFFLSVLILCVQLGFSQAYDDGIIQETERLKNAGWMSVPGQQKIEDQIIKAKELLRLKGNNGERVYEIFDGYAVANTLSLAGYMANSYADTTLKKHLVSSFEKLLFASNLNIEKRQLVRENLTNIFFKKVLRKLEKITVNDIYRDFESCEKSPDAKGKLSEGMVECQVRVFCKWEESLTIAKKALEKPLQENSQKKN